ncbi:hypothetical protein GUITHDRAFT_116755 [Guillardia theta CCMP2712]|uniref:Uncharacterized protein n=1 Tax=Guillardia theta (strain CCMP2712) TaxID=905079 RepID=L1IM99_GUITC|nr:hypothetical protein GUITHDRAFT_116755 [Guillardia theta CCMP2712]EKX37029.1 hypothetical protein GUITHDRAFT_116755 [Guillardia theta CCMP2712]|eukprot:XP_005824009.1 hypothetical protein GUITHDRAFT_116755 [Guillardia theta CCMP2712]
MSAFGMRQRRVRTRTEEEKATRKEGTMKMKLHQDSSSLPAQSANLHAKTSFCPAAMATSLETPPPQSPSDEHESVGVRVPQQEMSYEEKRRQNIARNKELMRELGLQDTAKKLDQGKDKARVKKKSKDDDDESFQEDDDMMEEEEEVNGKKSSRASKQAATKRGKLQMMLAGQAAETVCADYGREIIGRAIKVSVFTVETSKNEWHYAEIVGHRWLKLDEEEFHLYAIDDVPSCDSGDEEEKDDENALDVKKLKYGVCVAASCYEDGKIITEYARLLKKTTDNQWKVNWFFTCEQITNAARERFTNFIDPKKDIFFSMCEDEVTQT